MFRSILITALALAATALAQQVAFTTRAEMQSPVVISSFGESKVYGFESITLWNDGPATVSAVQLRVTFHNDSGDEVVEERRFAVEIQPHERKRVIADLGHVEGLRQKAKSSGQANALAVLTLKGVEFRDGAAWQPDLPSGGVPIDTLPPLQRLK